MIGRVKLHVRQLIIVLWILPVLTCYKGQGLSPTAEGDIASGIEGRITFVGTLPDSTKEMRVAALTLYPKGMTDPDSIMTFVIGHLAAVSDTIPRHVPTYDYRLPLEPGVYAWIVVVWFPDIPVYFFGVKELGAYYSDPNDAETPTPVHVVQGLYTPDIDITADFSHIQQGTPFF